MTVYRSCPTTMAGHWWILFFAHCFGRVCLAYTDTVSCGPKGKCTCTHEDPRMGTKPRIKIRCDETSLSNVCRYIDTQTRFVHLVMVSSNIRKINKSDMDGCNKLHRLYIRNNELTHISDNAFSEMGDLTELIIYDNSLQDLYKGITPHFLEPVRKLQFLSLRVLNSTYENQTLSYPDLSAVSNLNTLELDGLRNTVLPEQYASFTNLTTLTLSGCKKIQFCQMDRLSEITFQNVNYVETLDISCCTITSVGLETFKSLPRLKWLDISHNRQLGLEPLSNISYGLQFTNIDFLNYSFNDNTFGLSQMLTKQNICFLRNTTLREFAIGGNRLELFETNALILVPKTLEIIHVNDNVLTFGLYALQIACMENIKQIDASFLNRAHNNPRVYLKEIENKEPQCRHQQVQPYCPFLNESFLINTSKGIDQCQYFKQKPLSLGPVPMPHKLTHITLSDCNLYYRVPRVPLFPLRNVLESVDVSGNILYKLQGPIGPANALKRLKLDRNYCSYIGPNFFIYMMNVTSLDLQKNLLGELLENQTSAVIFKPLSKLQSLNMSHNLIKKLAPNVFSYLTSLETLDLSYNSIDTWTIDTANLPYLRHLYLRFNSLVTLPESLTDHLTRCGHFTIDLTNNPIRYSCSHKTFLKWMVVHERSFVGFNGYIFLDDNGKLMTVEKFREDIKYIDSLCRSYTMTIMLCSVGITIFLTAIMAGLVYKNRWKLRYFMYMNKTRLRGYRSSYEPLECYKHDAFVSYSDENSEFRDAIIKNFEDDVDLVMNIKLCLHERDFKPGRAIAENIIDAIQNSKKTIITLSNAYLNSKWCLHEFHMARLESIYSRSGKGIIIVVMLEDVPLDNKMPLELMQWIKQDSYLEYTTDEQGQFVFWEKLRESILE